MRLAMIFLAAAILVMAACTHKIVSKNCLQAEGSEYFVCDTLNYRGQ